MAEYFDSTSVIGHFIGNYKLGIQNLPRLAGVEGMP